jgi:hypothetical protein
MREETMNDECRVMNGRPAKRRVARLVYLILFSSFIIHLSSFSALATPTQEDVFKSIQSNVNDQIDGRKMMAFFAGAAGVIIMIVLINNRQQRVERPKVLNHQTKLLRELMKTAGLKSAQVRQLKMLSADLRERNQPVENLVTLLLCPSLIQKARGDERPGDSGKST